MAPSLNTISSAAMTAHQRPGKVMLHKKISSRRLLPNGRSQGIGLEFEQVNSKGDAEVRIGFKQGDGAWSYVGRDVIDIAGSPDERTMNFGWNIANDIDTAIHEIGHTLGAPHEHQNPNAGIVWDEEAVYAALAKPPNSWSREKTFHNIIRKLPVDEIEGSTHDPNSVMHYPFEPGLILEPEEFRAGINPAGGLSDKDKEFVKKFYPPLTSSDYVNLKLSQSSRLPLRQANKKISGSSLYHHANTKLKLLERWIQSWSCLKKPVPKKYISPAMTTVVPTLIQKSIPGSSRAENISFGSGCSMQILRGLDLS